jgi:hypothetical protein
MAEYLSAMRAAALGLLDAPPMTLDGAIALLRYSVHFTEDVRPWPKDVGEHIDAKGHRIDISWETGMARMLAVALERIAGGPDSGN